MTQPLHPDLPTIYTVSDDVDAVIRLAEYLSHIEEEFLRYDYSLNDAAVALKSSELVDIAKVIIAPSELSTTKPVKLMEVVDEATELGAECTILLTKEMSLPTQLRKKGVNIVSGPPFGPHTRIDRSKNNQIAYGASTFGILKREPITHWLTAIASNFSRPQRKNSENFANVQYDHRNDILEHQKEIRVICFQGMAGGVGATTIATNFAVELSRKFQNTTVCLMDFNLQFGNAANLLNITSNPKIIDAYKNISRIDIDAFRSLLHTYSENLSVFNVPPEIMPIDALNDNSIEKLIHHARSVSTYIIIDLPSSVPDWYGKIVVECDELILVSVADVRCAHNSQKLLELLGSEGLPISKCQFVLNKVPKRPDKSWLSHQKNFELGLNKQFRYLFNDGGPEIANLANAGLPVWNANSSNLLKKSITEFSNYYIKKEDYKLAESI